MGPVSIVASFKPLDELTLMDDYTFGVVVQDPALRRPLPEYILDIRIRAATTRQNPSEIFSVKLLQ